MFKVEIYKRDKNGNRGNLITTIKYPEVYQAAKAKAALQYLCTHQNRFPKEWNLKNCIIAGPRAK